MFEINAVSGIGEYTERTVEDGGRSYAVPEGKVFAVVRLDGDGEVKTVEMRSDENLSKVLREKYESVMGSRYFGRGGVEIVLSGQLALDEVYDLVRLSYNLTKEME